MKGALPKALSGLVKGQLYHITTPIFYPNAKPHLGHLYSSLLCDVSARWHAMLGDKTLFTTGTDEHGLKIQTASEAKGYRSPKEFVDILHQEFVKLDELANVDFSRFIRTTDEDHNNSVRELWNRCWRHGYIYKGEHSGWYSVSDECFYPDSKVVRIKKDSPGAIDSKDGKFINTETGNEVVFQSETNYFFKLSALQDKLIDLLENEKPEFISPPSRRDQILNDLKTSQLRDISVSRPSSRIRWGIDVPQDSTQKIYVWFDALCNYLASIGGTGAVATNKPVFVRHKGCDHLKNPGDWFAKTTHLIGKDIAKFHTIYWPSFLLAAELPLPREVVIHGHWLSGGIKMSKSLGNVVDPIAMISYYGCDTMRWYILENSHIEADGDFREERLHATREQLVSKWGNLLNRCCGKKFNVHRAVKTFAKPEALDEDLSRYLENPATKDGYSKIVKQLERLPGAFNEAMLKLDTRSALKLLWEVIGEANAFVQSGTPWLKSNSEQDIIIFVAMETVRITAILSQPIIPSLSNEFLDRIDIDTSRRSLKYAEFGLDSDYGKNSNEGGRSVVITRKPLRIE
ncbi:LADA_0D10946g1_1 [Lachancea dasiensis]|uniref:Methionine--tRNA ligase, mitochondrial n=1 Tax=Lachancea dasiensis TaxID=1072105 RepID=A0A1G4J7S1_9SACH|nr:LADA_0D10946g1_1 [Lachancea dasiensis]